MALQTLFGFERIHVKAGHTVSVWLYPSLLDFTGVNEAGVRQVLAGEWKVRFGVKQASTQGQGFSEETLLLV